MSPRTIRLLLAYDGTDFRGWAAQRDPTIRTVEGVITGALEAVLDQPVKLSVAGRTDAGVHARGQVASFVTASPRDAHSIRAALNGQLAPEIVARSVAQARTGFDARFSASAREYRYRIAIGDVPDPFTARWAWHHPCKPALGDMRAATRHLVGEHDFTSFCRHPGSGKSTVRDLQRVTVWRRDDRLELRFRANAFLHQMVRALTGTLVAVGEGTIDAEAVPAIVDARNRAAARHLAPPHGLTLERVVYGPARRDRD